MEFGIGQFRREGSTFTLVVALAVLFFKWVFFLKLAPDRTNNPTPN